jgi:hypothetical protein
VPPNITGEGNAATGKFAERLALFEAAKQRNAAAA